MREQQTEVLVVGAGPVGLLTANLLADAGIQVQIIDREARTATRSHACALHSRTLKLLARIGLAPLLRTTGSPLHKVAFYEGKTRHAEIDLSELGGEFPFLLVVPQSHLEDALEQRLKQKHSLGVRWNCRCAGLREERAGVTAAVERLSGTGTGYVVPHWETVVLKRFPLHARLLVGADGHKSLVREHLGIECEHTGKVESFATIQFETDAAGPDELRIVVDGDSSNALWPLPNHQQRWVLQLPHSKLSEEYPEKVRSDIRMIPADNDAELLHWIKDVCRHRAPWFSDEIKEIFWCSQVGFEPMMAKQFGRGYTWLAGDAAHQTGPIGVQSMNVGLLEAECLAASFVRILRDGADVDLLAEYDRDFQREWRGLLTPEGRLQPCSETDRWVREHLPRILPCLPASGEDLVSVANQLRLNVS